MSRACLSVNPRRVFLAVQLAVSGACGDIIVEGTGSSGADTGSTGVIIDGAATTDSTTANSGAAGTTTDVGESTGGSGDTGDTSTTLVNPGTTGDGSTGEPVVCDAPAMPLPCDHDSTDPFNAIGLGCSDDPGEAVTIEDAIVKALDSKSFRVATRFGSAQDPDKPALPAWRPREGERMLVLGTGLFPNLDENGALIEENGEDSHSNGNLDDQKLLPGVIKHKLGSNNGLGGTPFVDCDGLRDCSDTIWPQWELAPNNVAYDVFYMAFDLDAPAGTHGFALDFAFFSEEWPVYVDTTYNDMLVIWSTSEGYTGNVAYVDGAPLTATALDPYMVYQPGDPRLAGTGFPGDDEGAATDWMTARGSALPGEKFTVAIAIFDIGDALWDSVALVDHFRWDCEGCVAAPAGDCGVTPP